MYRRECDFIIEATRLDRPFSWPAQTPNDLNWNFVLRVLLDNRMSGLAHWRLNKAGVVIPELAELEAHYRSNQFRNTIFLDEAARILRAFSQADVPVLPTKGILWIDSACPVGARKMGDIDLLVPRGHHQRAIEVMQTIGYVTGHKSHASELGQKDSVDLFLVKGTHCVPVDVSRRFLHKADDHGTNMSLEAVFQRAHARTLAGVETKELDVIDQLIHTAAHVVLHHELRFLPGIVDVCALIQRSPGFDWTALEQRAKECGMWRPTLCALGLAQELYELSLADHIESQWRTLRKRIERGPEVQFLDRLWILGDAQAAIMKEKGGGWRRSLALFFLRLDLADYAAQRLQRLTRLFWPDRTRMFKTYRVKHPVAVWALRFIHVPVLLIALIVGLPLLWAIRPLIGARIRTKLGNRCMPSAGPSPNQ